MTPENNARAAGWSLLIMAVLAGFAFGYVYSPLSLAENQPLSAQHLPVIRLSIAAWWGIALLDVLVALALLQLFAPAHYKGATIMAGLRLLYTVGLGVAIFRLHQAARLLATAEQAQQALEAWLSFEYIWSAALIIFGLHLCALGWLCFKAAQVPTLWGWLLLAAGISYLTVHLSLQFPSAASLSKTLETVLSLPMALGELGFAIWLLLSVRKQKKPYPLSAQP